MKYENPILQGFYPDPSICSADGKYYMVCSSFQYFPGVPLFESDDLINWVQISHCLTRPSQVDLKNINSSGGIFAPTIRYNNGVFYMTTTNDTTHQNFYIWTDDVYSEWSEPIFVDQGGIDPSLFFENDKVYFMSNEEDKNGKAGVVQCEIDILTGEKQSPARLIWEGSGGRYLESPHLYKINNYYYLLAAEGGTEYGHMVTYARGESPYGPFENFKNNPVLTNRNLGGHIIQGVGHGDLIQAPDGNYYLIHLGFRQTGQWSTFHHLGREVFITSITFDDDLWFTAGDYGTTRQWIEVPHGLKPQNRKNIHTFKNTNWNLDWCHLRLPENNNYIKSKNSLTLHGSNVSLNECESPTFLGIRQQGFNVEITCNILLDHGESGITIYMDENHHYDLAINKLSAGYEVILRLCIGNIKSIESRSFLGEHNFAQLKISATNEKYSFFVKVDNQYLSLGEGFTRYLSSEVAGGFTGVIIGLYTYSPVIPNRAVITDFKCLYDF